MLFVELRPEYREELVASVKAAWGSNREIGE
jgi:hypothetical protein